MIVMKSSVFPAARETVFMKNCQKMKPLLMPSHAAITNAPIFKIPGPVHRI